MVARHFGTLALIAVGVFALVSDLRPSVTGNAGLIGGPYAYLLASSTDLGPSHRADTQLTAALRDPTRSLGDDPRPQCPDCRRLYLDDIASLEKTFWCELAVSHPRA